MTCEGCNKPAKYMLYEHLEPHCESCYQDALEGCTQPFLIMTYEAWEVVQREQQRELSKTA